MVFPIKKPKRNTAKAIIQVDLSIVEKKSVFSEVDGGGGGGNVCGTCML
tara:strand:+ start:3069 stop:3215 length:147 start_codon:yes stop_codon:yes gene_type:complete